MFEKYEEVLTKATLFKNIDKKELKNTLICLKPTIMAYEKNENIALTGMPCEGIGIILLGSAILSKESLIGNRLIIDILKPSEMFGETSKFSGYDLWPATITAEEYTEVMFITKERFLGSCERVCNSHRAIIYNMIEILAKKAIMLNKKIEYLSIKSLRARISAFIIDNYSINNKKMFDIDMNRADVADFLNVTRPALSREMGRMQEEGIIDYYKSTIKILDMEKLKNNLEY